MRIVALIASIGVALQTVITWYSGSGICPTQGCRIVEDLTLIQPLWVNFLGLLFFQAVFWSSRVLKEKTYFGMDPMGLLLSGALAFDSALLAYQIFVVQTFCAYCLVVFSVVLLLNLMYGHKQAVWSFTVLTAILLSFSILSFSPGNRESQTFSLKEAAFGVRSCSTPTKEVYLIFSSTCPHCQTVIESLEECNSCDLYLNPIDEIETLGLEDIERIESFSPQINRGILELLEIDTIPVLISKGTDSYRIIGGEENIVNYIRHACFTSEDVLFLERSFSPEDEGITVVGEGGEECSLTIDCDGDEHSSTN